MSGFMGVFHEYILYIYIQYTIYIYIYTYYNELVEILVEFFVEWAILKPTPTNCPTLYLDRLYLKKILTTCSDQKESQLG